MTKHRIRWDNEDDLTVDDLYAEKASVHLEQMDHNHYYLGVTAPDGTLYQVHLHSDSPVAAFAHISQANWAHLKRAPQ